MWTESFVNAENPDGAGNRKDLCQQIVDEQPELAGEFGVMSIPTLLVFEQGKLVRQAVGARPKASVLDLLG